MKIECGTQLDLEFHIVDDDIGLAVELLENRFNLGMVQREKTRLQIS